MRNKDDVIYKVKKTKLFISLALVVVLLLASVFQYTPIVKVYEINFIVDVILDNSVNILFIAIVLFILYKLEVRRFEEKTIKLKVEKD